MGSSILIRQHYAVIYNFDVKFVEICLVFLISLKTGWENLKRNRFRRSGAGAQSPLRMRAATVSVLTQILT